MSDSKLFDVRCEDCDFSEKRKPWKPGVKCPKCGSEKFYPEVVGAGEARGPDALTAEDVRFGRLAKWARFVRSAQLEECRAEQKNAIKKGAAIPSLSEIMIKKGYLAEEQIEMILRLQEAPLPTSDETQFLQTARLNNFISQEQLAECANLQTKMIVTGKKVIPIIDILLEKGYLTEDQVGIILRAQRTRQRGLLSALDSETEQNMPGMVSKELNMLGQPSRGGWRGYRIIAGAAVLLILAGAYYWSSKAWKSDESKPQATYKCTACGTVFKSDVSDTPAKCPKCGQSRGFYYLRCPHCGSFFTATGEQLKQSDLCPICKERVEKF